MDRNDEVLPLRGVLRALPGEGSGGAGRQDPEGARQSSQHRSRLQEAGMSPTDHRIVSHEEWLAERTVFLAKEKEFTKLVDAHNRERRQLPWERVTKAYTFEG